MNFFTFSAIRDLSDKMARENGLDYTGVNGSRLTSQFYHDVRRGRVRHLIKINDEEFGFVDFVTPFSPFKQLYEYYCLNYATTQPIKFDGIEWVEDPYPPDDGQKWLMPASYDIEAVISFYDFLKKKS